MEWGTALDAAPWVEEPMTDHHADRINAAVHSSDAVRSAIVASWRRSSALHHLDPSERRQPHRLTDNEFRHAREKVAPLAHAAKGTLDRLYLAVGGVGCCVLLANAEGVPIERRGAHADDSTFQDWGLWTGNVWSEQAEGTNGIGTCLVEKRLVTIHRDQHFLSRNTLMSCTTAPIFDHHGNLAAVLDVSSCRADLTEGFLNLIQIAVGDAAKRIEAESFRQSFPTARVVLAPVQESSPSALLAVDKDDLVIGVSNTARIALGLSQGEAIVPRPASEYFEYVQGASPSLNDAERSALQQALAASGGNISSAARALGISRATLHRKVAKHDLHK